MSWSLEEWIGLVNEGKTDTAKQRLAQLRGGILNSKGDTVYHTAVQLQNPRILRWLVSHYRDILPPTVQNHIGQTCFHMAIQMGKTATYLLLWEDLGVDPVVWCKIRDRHGHTALHYACLYGQSDIVRDLVTQLGTQIAYDLTEQGQSALHIAAAGGHAAAVRRLTQYKPLIDKKDVHGATPLHYATYGGHLKVVQYLMETCKADSRCVTLTSMNLTHAAVASGKLRVAQYIMSNTNRKTHFLTTDTGATVYHIASGLGNLEVLHFLLSQKYLLPILNAVDRTGLTAAHLAALRNRASCLSLLIQCHADIHIPDKRGFTTYKLLGQNQTAEMRQTFWYLFEKSSSSHDQQGKNRKSKKSQSHKVLNKTEPPSKTKDNRGGRTESSVVTVLDGLGLDYFPNPDYDDGYEKIPNGSPHRESDADVSTPESRKQRKFPMQGMILPGYDPLNPPTIIGYHWEDTESLLDDIELVPETPMRTIQQFNGFRHSAYLTPTQSVEDLTGTTDVTLPSEYGLNENKLHNQAVQSKRQDLLQKEYDLREKETDSVIDLIFRNPEINTVRIKTSTLSPPVYVPTSNGETGNQSQNKSESVIATGEQTQSKLRNPRSLRLDIGAATADKTEEVILTSSESSQTTSGSGIAESAPGTPLDVKRLSLVEKRDLLQSELNQLHRADKKRALTKQNSPLENNSLPTPPPSPPKSLPIEPLATPSLPPPPPISPEILITKRPPVTPPPTPPPPPQHPADALSVPGADTLERDYLKYSQNEMNQNPSSQQEQNGRDRAGKAKESSVVGVRFTEPEKKPATVQRSVSLTSDNSESQFDDLFNSRASYKLNYKAYRKKVIKKQDTVTDMFEYSIIE